MTEGFIQYNTRNKLFDQNDCILLTVSGGIDSMTMLELFHKLGYKYGIAHCNFMLRESESNQDQEFVRNIALKYNIEFHTINFETRKYAGENKISIQMAARDLRYNWFNQIALKYGYTKIATAHNLNDLAETFLINLSRGTGIKGLTGIPVKSGKIIRPLLFASRENIISYAKQHNITYREDSSNAETKYLRNAIRHNIIHAFEEITPHFLHALENTSRLLRSTHKIYINNIDKIRERLFIKKNNNEIQIEINQLKTNKIEAEILYDLLQPYNFTLDNCEKILNTLEHQPGIKYLSKTHRIIKDREYLIITENNEGQNDEIEVTENSDNRDLPFKMSIKRIKTKELDTFKLPPNIAIFDSAKVTFPLTLRKWRKGDYFYPLGMKGRKKISDFFNDNKFSIYDKENTWLLTSGKDIMWIINHRTDNRYRITETTKNIILIETKK